MSFPWRSCVVGSWMVKKTPRISRYEVTPGSNVSRTASACPVVPVHTSWYVGFSTYPPVYPDSTESTPSIFWYTASRHQKQPPARVAISDTKSAFHSYGRQFAAADDAINHAVLDRVFRLHDVVAIDIFGDPIHRLAGGVGEHGVQDFAHAEDFARVNIDIGGLA